MWFKLVQSRLIATIGPSEVLPLDGSKLALDLRAMHDVKTHWAISRQGAYEPETTALLRALVHEGDTFVDVGANNGYFTVLAQGRVRPQGRVIAVEPNPGAFQRLQTNIRLNQAEGIVDARHCAAGEKPGRTTLYVHPFEDGWGGVEPVRPPSFLRFPTEVVPLDGIVPPSPSLVVKIDVEGFEPAVLRGMARTVRETPNLAVIVEWNRHYANQEMWEALSSDLRVYRILPSPEDPGFALLRVRSPTELKEVLITNLLGVKGPAYASLGN